MKPLTPTAIRFLAVLPPHGARAVGRAQHDAQLATDAAKDASRDLLQRGLVDREDGVLRLTDAGRDAQQALLCPAANGRPNP